VTPFEYRPAESLEHGLELLAEYGDDARPIAGGTALVNLMKQRLVQPAVLVGLRGLGRDPLLGGVTRQADGSLWLGALATHTAVATSPTVQEGWPLVAEAFRRVATPRIRNIATVGGSLAHADPSQDPPAALLALDAEVLVVGPDGQRRIPLAGFFLDYYETVLEPGELVAGCTIPVVPPGSGWAYQKLLPRTEDDYATVAVAARVRLDDAGVCHAAGIALVGAGPRPLRAPAAEAALVGQHPAEATIAEAAELAKAVADPLDDWRGSARYKQRMVGVFTRRALAEAFERAGA
jgi:aerobic carbon-monoxide dehydrogenase medium subunit